MGVRFKLDENIPRAAEAVLASAGHDAQSALAEGLGGQSDSTVLDACLHEQRILVTFDLRFADIRLHPVASHYGIRVLRPHSQSVALTVTLLQRALSLLESETTVHRLWVLEPNRVRIRE